MSIPFAGHFFADNKVQMLIIYLPFGSATVDTWPEAFFVVGACTFALTFICLLFVRVRRPNWNGYSKDPNEEEPLSSDFLAA